MAKRPDMRDYFRARIDFHVNGWNARSTARIPNGIRRVNGDVTDSEIAVTMDDGSVWRWKGGGYAARKVNGCYSPLMPKPMD